MAHWKKRGGRFWTKKRVAERYDIHPNSIDRLVKQGRFPAPVKPFPGSDDNRWLEHELDEHDAARIAARDTERDTAA